MKFLRNCREIETSVAFGGTGSATGSGEVAVHSVHTALMLLGILPAAYADGVLPKG
jgi:hypothetical protein